MAYDNMVPTLAGNHSALGYAQQNSKSACEKRNTIEDQMRNLRELVQRIEMIKANVRGIADQMALEGERDGYLAAFTPESPEDHAENVVPGPGWKPNPPFDRLPQHANDPGFGPVPPSYDELQSQLATVTKERDDLSAKMQWYCDYANDKDREVCAEMERANVAESQLSARDTELARLREALHKIWCAHRSLAYVQEIAHAALAAPVTEKE